MIIYSTLQEKREILRKGVSRLREYRNLSLGDLEVHNDRIDLCIDLFKHTGRNYDLEYSHTLKLETTFEELLPVDEDNVDSYLSRLAEGTIY